MRTPARSLILACLFGLFAGFAALCIADRASAQNADSVDATSDESLATEGLGEEVVVDERRPESGTEIIQIIGTRRESLAQAEALSITAFDQASLDELGIQDVDSLQQFVPSLHIGQVGTAAVITLRGIGFDNLTVLGEPGVVFEVDGVPLSRPSAANALFYDVENVQVFRGPQGTQGGRNSTAGRIAISSARPTADFEAFGDTQFGTANQILQRGVLNIPIWEEYLMSRISAVFEKRDGYQRNILPQFGSTSLRQDDANDFAIRSQLLSHTTDNLQLRGIATYAQQKGIGPGFKTIGPLFKQARTCPDTFQVNRPGGPSCPIETLSGLDTVINPASPRESSQNTIGLRDDHQYGFTGHLDWDLPTLVGLGDTSFGAVASYQLTHNEQGGNDPLSDRGIDLDATNSIVSSLKNDQTARQQSFEIFMESRDSDIVQWKFGFFSLNELIDSDSVLYALHRPNTLPTITESVAETRTKAGYGEFSFWLLDNVQLAGGMRYTRGNKSIARNAYRLKLDPQGDPIAESRIGNTARVTTWEAWTPKALLKWDVTDASSLSVSATRGFKLGGFSLPALPTATENSTGQEGDSQASVLQYDPERVWSYEFLSKNTFNDGDLVVNVSLFWVDYSAYQACLITPEGFRCSVGNASTKGVEFESNWSPIPGMRIDAIFNYLNSKIEGLRIRDDTERMINPDGSPNPLFDTLIDVSGRNLTKAPKFSVTLGGQYEFDLADFGLFGYLTPRFTYRFQTRTYYRVFNLEKFSQKPFHKIDFKVTWRSEDDRFSVEATVENITDVAVINSIIVGSPPIGSPVLAAYLPPRTFGVKIGYRF